MEHINNNKKVRMKQNTGHDAAHFHHFGPIKFSRTDPEPEHLFVCPVSAAAPGGNIWPLQCSITLQLCSSLTFVCRGQKCGPEAGLASGEFTLTQLRWEERKKERREEEFQC